MASVTALREGIAAQLDSISGLRIKAFEPDKVAVPSAAIALVSIAWDKTMGRGMDSFEFVVRLYASRATDKGGQNRIDSYLAGSGPTSVKAAIEADRTLGGVAHTLQVTGVDNYGSYEVGGINYYGVEFAVLIWARGI